MQADFDKFTNLELRCALGEPQSSSGELRNDVLVLQFRQLPGNRGEQPADRGVTRRVKRRAKFARAHPEQESNKPFVFISSLRRQLLEKVKVTLRE